MSVEDDLATIREDLDKFEAAYESAQASALSKKIESAASSLKGITRGHLREVLYATKHLEKKRTVILQKHADVTIGNDNDVFAKSVQLKSSSATKPNDVDTLLAKAAYQISGAKGEVPRENDRRIIDVAINHPDNPWPFTTSKTETLERLLKESERRILKYVNEGKAASERGLTKSGIEHIDEVGSFELGKSLTSTLSKAAGARSTLLRVAKHGDAEKRFVFSYLTIKIRFTFFRKVIVEGKHDKLITAVFVIFKANQKLSCEYVAYQLKVGGKQFFKLNPIAIT